MSYHRQYHHRRRQQQQSSFKFDPAGNGTTTQCSSSNIRKRNKILKDRRRRLRMVLIIFLTMKLLTTFNVISIEGSIVVVAAAEAEAIILTTMETNKANMHTNTMDGSQNSNSCDITTNAHEKHDAGGHCDDDADNEGECFASVNNDDRVLASGDTRSLISDDVHYDDDDKDYEVLIQEYSIRQRITFDEKPHILEYPDQKRLLLEHLKVTYQYVDRLFTEGDPITALSCRNLHEQCSYWATFSNECYNNPRYMSMMCPPSCQVCFLHSYKEYLLLDMSSYGNIDGSSDWGVSQLYHPHQPTYKTYFDRMVVYMMHHIEPIADIQIKQSCKNFDMQCLRWATLGECSNNPSYMTKFCGPACQTCDKTSKPTILGSGASGIATSTINVKNDVSDNSKSSSDKVTVPSIWGEAQIVPLVQQSTTSNDENSNSKEGISTSTSSNTDPAARSILHAIDPYMRMIQKEYPWSSTKCRNQHSHCVYWASLGECTKNPKYMRAKCAPACQTCEELLSGNSDESAMFSQERGQQQVQEYEQDISPFGKGQTVMSGPSGEATRNIIKEMLKYMTQTVMVEEEFAVVKDHCRCRDERCAKWASTGECDANPSYMKLHCAPVCQSCMHVSYGYRCPFDRDGPRALNPGDLNSLFHRITSDEYYVQHFAPTILSSPETTAGGPWVVQFDNFIRPEECDSLISHGGSIGYASSVTVGTVVKFDGTREGNANNPARTSTNAWCNSDPCKNDTHTRNVFDRIENVTGIPERNSEALQLLRYQEGQFYKVHHDYLEHHYDQPQGVRILTFFIYLNDVESGGETHFPKLNLTVTPKRGRAILWPSVLDEDPNAKDDRTDHEALPVLEGIKFGANAWLHQRDYEDAQSRGCT